VNVKNSSCLQAISYRPSAPISGIDLAQLSTTGGSFMRQDTDLFKTILVPVDFSPCSEQAFQVACQMARLCGATVLVLHVIDTSTLAAFHRLGLLAVPSDAAPQRRRLRHHARLKVRQLLESRVAADVKIERQIVEGVPFVEIAKVARTGKVDLVVIGGYGGRVGNVDKIFFGSTAERVVRTADCPVLTVPPLTSASQRRS
jgi:nucleotide-binding universal stress UspA family protein